MEQKKLFLPPCLPKGEHFHLLLPPSTQLKSIFSLFSIFKCNNQRWFICDNTFPVIFYLHFHLSLLVPGILYIGTHWVFGIFTCMFVLFPYGGTKKAESRVHFFLQTKDESNLPLWFSCWMGFRRFKYYFLSTGNIILPTSLSKLPVKKGIK